MEFQVTTVYDAKSLAILARGLRKTLRRTSSRRSHIFAWAVIVLGILVIAARILVKMPWTPIGVLTIAAVLMVFITLMMEDRLNGYFAWKRMLPGTEQTESFFTPQGYQNKTAAAETQFHYENIQCLCETEDYVLFFLSKNHGQLYDKQNLTGGTVEEFRIFLIEITGKPIQTV